MVRCVELSRFSYGWLECVEASCGTVGFVLSVMSGSVLIS